jgi:hypothetical protein
MSTSKLDLARNSADKRLVPNASRSSIADVCVQVLSCWTRRGLRPALTVAIGVVVRLRPAIPIWVSILISGGTWVVSAVCALPGHVLLSQWPGAAAGFEEHPATGSASAHPRSALKRIFPAIILIGVAVGAVLLVLSH